MLAMSLLVMVVRNWELAEKKLNQCSPDNLINSRYVKLTAETVTASPAKTFMVQLILILSDQIN